MLPSFIFFKMVFFLPFYVTEKKSVLHLVPEDFCEKIIVWKNCIKIIWKYSELNYAEFQILTEMDSFSFSKISTDQTYTSLSSKLVYSIKNYLEINLWRKKIRFSKIFHTMQIFSELCLIDDLVDFWLSRLSMLLYLKYIVW